MKSRGIIIKAMLISGGSDASLSYAYVPLSMWVKPILQPSNLPVISTANQKIVSQLKPFHAEFPGWDAMFRYLKRNTKFILLILQYLRTT